HGVSFTAHCSLLTCSSLCPLWFDLRRNTRALLTSQANTTSPPSLPHLRARNDNLCRSRDASSKASPRCVNEAAQVRAKSRSHLCVPPHNTARRHSISVHAPDRSSLAPKGTDLQACQSVARCPPRLPPAPSHWDRRVRRLRKQEYKVAAR